MIYLIIRITCNYTLQILRRTLMKLIQIIHILGSFFLFLILLGVNWYQGSGITDYPSEWQYTAKFTHLFHGMPQDYHEINQLDFFVYSAKFYPKTFAFMMFSLVYFLIITFMAWRNYKVKNIFLNLNRVVKCFK